MSDMPREQPPVDRLVGELNKGRVSRRVFIARASALGLSLPTIATVLAACGGGDDTSDTADTEQKSVKLAEGQPGGTLREGYDQDFSRMDPINTSWYDPAFFALYEAVVTRDADNKFVPELAESWETSEDGLTWTFKLRPDVKFHSGAALDAEMVARVFNTIIDPDAASPQLAQWAPVKRTRAIDATTFEVQVAHPFANLPNVISTGYSRICNMDMREKLGDDYAIKKLDGSGPFTFTKWVPGSSVSVERWEEYPGPIVPFFVNKEKAYLDGIDWRFIPESATRALQIEQGELDTLKGPAYQDVERLKSNGDLVVTEVGEQSLWYLGLNFERLEFGDLKVRQAVSQAIDRDAIVDRLVFGHGKAAYGPLPPAAPDYDSAVEEHNQFDPERAKALMEEAGWTAGGDGTLAKDGKPFEFELATSNESFMQTLGTVIQEQLRDIGMKVRVRSYDGATHFQKMGEGVDSFLFRYAWPNPYDVYIVISDSGAAPVPNWQRASIKALDQAHRDYQEAADEEQLQAASSKGQTVGAEELPFVPIFNPSAIWVNRKQVRNYMPISWNLWPYYNDVWIEQES